MDRPQCRAMDTTHYTDGRAKNAYISLIHYPTRDLLGRTKPHNSRESHIPNHKSHAVHINSL